MPVTGYVGSDGRSNVPGDIEVVEDQELTQEMEESLHELWKASGLEDSEAKAQFKLEVIFHDDRSSKNPYLGTIVAWTNGGYMNGGGDESIYFCPAKTEKGSCFTPIDIRLVHGDIAVCPTCRSAHDAKALIGQITAKLHTQQWSELLTRMFYRLGSNADIRIGHFRGDIRMATALEKEAPKKGDRLDRVYRDRLWVVYPLKEMMREMSTRDRQSSPASVRSSVRKRKPKPKPVGPTLGQVTEKVSSLRSRIAVTDALVVYLETHYQGIDGEEPEERIFRDDYAQVPPTHIDEYVGVLRANNEILESELQEWEAMPVHAPPAKKAEDTDDKH